MIRSLEKSLRGVERFVHSEEGLVITGGVVLGLLAFGNMHFGGVSQDLAEVLVNKVLGSRLNLPPVQSLESINSDLHNLRNLLASEMSLASGAIGFIGGKALTRKLIIWDL